jgi:hypothetical protein
MSDDFGGVAMTSGGWCCSICLHVVSIAQPGCFPPSPASASEVRYLQRQIEPAQQSLLDVHHLGRGHARVLYGMEEGCVRSTWANSMTDTTPYNGGREAARPTGLALRWISTKSMSQPCLGTGRAIEARPQPHHRRRADRQRRHRAAQSPGLRPRTRAGGILRHQHSPLRCAGHR